MQNERTQFRFSGKIEFRGLMGLKSNSTHTGGQIARRVKELRKRLDRDPRQEYIPTKGKLIEISANDPIHVYTLLLLTPGGNSAHTRALGARPRTKPRGLSFCLANEWLAWPGTMFQEQVQRRRRRRWRRRSC
jgi:hypothetical protein